MSSAYAEDSVVKLTEEFEGFLKFSLPERHYFIFYICPLGLNNGCISWPFALGYPFSYSIGAIVSTVTWGFASPRTFSSLPSLVVGLQSPNHSIIAFLSIYVLLSPCLSSDVMLSAAPCNRGESLADALPAGRKLTKVLHLFSPSRFNLLWKHGSCYFRSYLAHLDDTNHVLPRLATG